jgi:hypothetical protein
MNRHFNDLQISLAELSEITGLTVEALQGDPVDKRFKFSLPPALRPYRYLIYAVVALLAVWLFYLLLALLIIAIVLPLLVLAIVGFITLSTLLDRTSGRDEKAMTGLFMQQQNSLKNLILHVHEHNIVVRTAQRIEAAISPEHSLADATGREAATTTLVLCRTYAIEALKLERELREGLFDARNSWGSKVLPVIANELLTGAEQGIGAASAAAAQAFLQEMADRRDLLRQLLGDTKYDAQTFQAQLAEAKSSRYGNVIRQSIQVLLNLQHEIRFLLSNAIA